MSFEIEAEDHDEAMARLKEWRRKVNAASQRLGIGFSMGTMTAGPQPPPTLASRVPRQVPVQDPPPPPAPPQPEPDPASLFDG